MEGWRQADGRGSGRVVVWAGGYAGGEQAGERFGRGRTGGGRREQSEHDRRARGGAGERSVTHWAYFVTTSVLYLLLGDVGDFF